MNLPFEVHFEGRLGRSQGEAPAGGELRAGGLEEVEALRLLHRAASGTSEDADYDFILGEALLRAGRVEEAVATLARAADARPDDVDYRMTLAEALWRCRRYEEAAEAFRAVAEQRPEDADAWSGLGASLIQAGQSSAALAALREVRRHDATRSEVLSNLGIACWQLDQQEQALAHFRSATQVVDPPSWAHHNLARALIGMGRRTHAIRALQEAARLAPADAEVHADLGDALVAAGRPSEAEEAYRQAATLCPACLEERPESQAAYRALATRSIRAELEIGPSLPARLLAHVVAVLVGAFGIVLRLLRRPATLAMFGLPALLAIVVIARLGPHYLTYFLFSDDMARVARVPVDDDWAVRDGIDRAIERRGLGSFLSASDCDIDSHAPWRTITCRYEVAVTPLPGWQTRLKFQPTVDAPFIVASKESRLGGDGWSNRGS